MSTQTSRQTKDVPVTHSGEKEMKAGDKGGQVTTTGTETTKQMTQPRQRGQGGQGGGQLTAGNLWDRSPFLFGNLMNMTPWSVFDDPFFSSSALAPLNEMERNLSNFPVMDFNESDKAYELTVDFPGIRKEDIKVDLNGRMLTISAKQGGKEETRQSRRRWSGEFVRSMTIPDDAKLESVNAKLDHGQLKVYIEKHDKKVAPSRSIEIQS
jgi:HSP20 family protein